MTLTEDDKSFWALIATIIAITAIVGVLILCAPEGHTQASPDTQRLAALESNYSSMKSAFQSLQMRVARLEQGRTSGKMTIGYAGVEPVVELRGPLPMPMAEPSLDVAELLTH